MMRGVLSKLGRILRHRALIALADQGAVSIASFGTGILLSRALGVTHREELGLYYLAVTIGVLIVEVQNALVSTPHTVTAPTLQTEQLRRYNGSSLIHHGGLSLIIMLLLALVALAAPAMGIPRHRAMLAACAVTAGALGLRNFMRFLNFALHRPHIACLGDMLVTMVQLAGIILLSRWNWVSAWSAVGIIGIASLAGGMLMLALSLHDIHPRLSLAWHDFRENWKLSRWVFASGVIGNAGCGVYPWIINPVQTALWGNCSTISSTGNPLLMGLQNWIAPTVSHAYARDQGKAFARHVYKSALLFLLILPVMLVVLTFISTPMLRHFYLDNTPGAVPLVLLLATGSFVASISFVVSRGLYSRGRGKLDVWSNLALLTVPMMTWPLVRAGGAVEAALSLLFAQCLAALVRVIMFAMTTPTNPPLPVPLPQEIGPPGFPVLVSDRNDAAAPQSAME